MRAGYVEKEFNFKGKKIETREHFAKETVALLFAILATLIYIKKQ